MKVGVIIPKKPSKHSQGSVARPEKERHKAYFGLKPQKWDKEKDNQIKCKPANVKAGKAPGFEKILYQLKGDEPPKKWILWKKDVGKKIVTKTTDWDLIFSSLINLTTKALATVIYDTFYALNILEGEQVKLIWGEYTPFCNKATQEKLLTFGTKKDGSAMNAIKGQAAWDALAKKPADINPLFLKEILFRLEELIFGTDMIGRNAYYLLKCLMQDYKVNSNQRVKEWQCRINQLNGYILHVPCDALENRSASKVQFTEIDMREILDFALPNSYQTKLFGIDWNIYEKPFMETIDKLQAIKPEIKVEAAKAKSNKALADKGYGVKGTKRNNNGTPWVADANKTTCKTCNKQHKGVCWKLNGGGNAGSNNRNGSSGAFNKHQMKVMNKMFKSHSSTKKDESDYKSEALAEGWKKRINLVQQMYITQQYRTDNGMDSNKEIVVS